MVSSCIFVSCVHPVAVLNLVFCSLKCVNDVEDERGRHLDETYQRVGRATYRQP